MIYVRLKTKKINLLYIQRIGIQLIFYLDLTTEIMKLMLCS